MGEPCTLNAAPAPAYLGAEMQGLAWPLPHHLVCVCVCVERERETYLPTPPLLLDLGADRAGIAVDPEGARGPSVSRAGLGTEPLRARPRMLLANASVVRSCVFACSSRIRPFTAREWNEWGSLGRVSGASRARLGRVSGVTQGVPRECLGGVSRKCLGSVSETSVAWNKLRSSRLAACVRSISYRVSVRSCAQPQL